MSEKVNKKSQWEREDDYNPSHDYSNSIQEKWVHKQVVKKTGDSEDDFIIEEKPVKIDEVDLHKQINEEAKTTDLKYCLKQFLMTGDESFINKRPGFYGDVTQIQKSIETGQSIVTPSQIKSTLPDEFKNLSVEQLAMMSDEDIVGYFKKVIEQKQVQKEESVQETVQETVEGEK